VVVSADRRAAFTLAVVASGGGCEARTEMEVAVASCTSRDCPRTAGFWKKECEAQQGPASIRLTRDQMVRIAERADERSTYFAWGAGTDLDRFCANDREAAGEQPPAQGRAPVRGAARQT